MRSIHKFILAAGTTLLGFTSCDWLDVAPAKQATFEDALKDKRSVEAWCYGCYAPIGEANPAYAQHYEGSADEFVYPRPWGSAQRYIQPVAFATLSATTHQSDYWRKFYGVIGNVHLFQRELKRQNPAFLTEDDKKTYYAHGNFMKAYCYFRLVSYYGPVPIIDEYVGSDMTIDKFPGRSHYDYCVDYICDLFDKAAADLTNTYTLDENYGKANKTICAAFKSRLLLYAASDLWNGKFPYTNWRNENFETPGYGKELVSYQFDIEKWKRAKTATEDAIELAKQSGRELLKLEDAASMAQRDMLAGDALNGCWIPGVDTSTEEGKEFAQHVMLMRYLVASEEPDGNHELIFTANTAGNASESYDNGTFEQLQGCLPRRILRNNSGGWQSGYNSMSPTLNAVEAFYTKDGKPLKNDPMFASEDEWLTSAGISKGDQGRPEIIKLNVGREPRFYAWINFDGCDVGPVIQNGQPFRLDLRDSEKGGYNPAEGDNQCQTGYLVNKYTAPGMIWSSNSRNIPNKLWPQFRLAELYLNLAECCAELYMHGEAGELQPALDNLNIVRRRAGIPELEESDCTPDMSIRDWVRAERRNELYAEGHRFYDLRRWVVADRYLAAGVRQGLDSFVSKIQNPSIEQFNRRVQVDGDYAWHNRLYLLPVDANDCYKNPQMVQAPGY